MAASRSIARVRRAIVLAGSGMCEGGRVQEHLARCLPDPACSVIVTGYQAEGTLGRKLVEGIPRVTIHGTVTDVRAKVHTINGLSAHADQGGLLEWVAGFDAPKPRIFLVHGEPEKMSILANALVGGSASKSKCPAGERLSSCNRLEVRWKGAISPQWVSCFSEYPLWRS